MNDITNTIIHRDTKDHSPTVHHHREKDAAIFAKSPNVVATAPGRLPTTQGAKGNTVLQDFDTSAFVNTVSKLNDNLSKKHAPRNEVTDVSTTMMSLFDNRPLGDNKYVAATTVAILCLALVTKSNKLCVLVCLLVILFQRARIVTLEANEAKGTTILAKSEQQREEMNSFVMDFFRAMEEALDETNTNIGTN